MLDRANFFARNPNTGDAQKNFHDKWIVSSEDLPQFSTADAELDAPELPNPDERQEKIDRAKRDVYAVFSGDDSNYEQTIQKSEILDRFEQQHFVKSAPCFGEQLQDTARTTEFVYFDRKPGEPEPGTKRQMAEHEGLKQLDMFLEASIESDETDFVRAKARKLREDLTFIGQPEYDEATQGIADYWKSLLDSNESEQLCVLTGLAAEQPGEIKSDDYLLESILGQFSDGELEAYRGRIVNSLDAVTSQAAKIVLLDDWVVSGQQMGQTCAELLATHPEVEGKLEIHCITTRDESLQQGLAVSERSIGGTSHQIPVKAYYKAHAARIAGLHSVPKQGYKYDLEMMLNAQNSERSTLPALATLRKPYTVPGYAPVRKRMLASPEV